MPTPTPSLTYFFTLNLQDYVLKAKKCPLVKVITGKPGDTVVTSEQGRSGQLRALRTQKHTCQLTLSPLSLWVASVLLVHSPPAHSSGCSAALGFESTFGCGFSGCAVMDYQAGKSLEAARSSRPHGTTWVSPLLPWSCHGGPHDLCPPWTQTFSP